MENVTLQNIIHETIYIIKERVPKSIEPPQDIAEKIDTLEHYGQILQILEITRSYGECQEQQ